MSSVSSQDELAIRLRGVTKIYESGARALGPIDLDIRKGEFVSLLGASGCGKSTALRLIAGLAAPTSGSIEVPARASRYGIGFVFQEPTLMPWTTVRENVRLPLILSHVAGAESTPRVDEARVSLARALVTSPDVLLLDEPFAALDEITRFKLNNDLLTLWRKLGKTVVFVTHSVYESVYLSQRIVVMTSRPGRIHRECRVEAPEPRDDAFRMSVAYAGYCRDVSQALMQAGEVPA